MPDHVVDRIAELLNEDRLAVNGAQILVLGVAYKTDVDDMRESPALDVIAGAPGARRRRPLPRPLRRRVRDRRRSPEVGRPDRRGAAQRRPGRHPDRSPGRRLRPRRAGRPPGLRHAQRHQGRHPRPREDHEALGRPPPDPGQGRQQDHADQHRATRPARARRSCRDGMGRPALPDRGGMPLGAPRHSRRMRSRLRTRRRTLDAAAGVAYTLGPTASHQPTRLGNGRERRRRPESFRGRFMHE